MTDKQFTFGKGRLTFSGGLKRPSRPLGESYTFKAAGKLNPDAYAVFAAWFKTAQITSICGYNPQMLLTDQRPKIWSPERTPYFPHQTEFRDTYLAAIGSRFGETYEETVDRMYPTIPPDTTHVGGIVHVNPTGRFRRGPEIQYLRPSGEGVLKRLRKFSIQDYDEVDYSTVEARVFSAIKVPAEYMQDNRTSKAQVQSRLQAYTAAVESRLKKAMESIDQFQDAVFMCVLGTMDPRVQRIARLVDSNDPRQRKRGNRLWKQFRGAELEKKWVSPHSSTLAYFNDVTRYRKD